MTNSSDSDRFLEVIEAHKGIIYKIANSYSKNSDDRNDLVQEIVMKLWQVFDSYNDKYAYSTWIYRIALNTAITDYRRGKVRAKHFSPITSPIFETIDEHETDDKEKNHSILHEFIFELKEIDKALMLLYLDEKNYKEIAEIVGISETNVATKISRIKMDLKKKFLTINN